jgi:uncharacterized protein YjiK
MRITLLALLCGLFSIAQTVKINPISTVKTEVTEPSDICLNLLNNKTFFTVSDDGYLHETDADGKIIKTADYRGIDTEAVYAKDDLVYVVQEFSRKISVFDASTLVLKQTLTIPYSGGRNKGYESFTFNAAKNKFVILTEKDPIYLFELDEKMTVVNEIELKAIARDISAATYYNNHLWLLSDDDRTVLKVNPTNYEVVSKWIVPIINPEGIAFNAEGKLIIVSDDRKMIYYFDNPEN